MNSHILQYLLERAQSESEDITFMNRKGEYRGLSYQALWQKIKSYAYILDKKGIKEGDIVSLMLPTCEEFLYAFFATQMLKATPVSIYPPQGLEELSLWEEKSIDMMNSVGSKHLVTNLQISTLLVKIRRSSNKSELLLIEELNKNEKHYSFDIELYRLEDLCFLQFSSGTTGVPKAVQISQENAIINTNIIIDNIPTRKEDISITSWLPLYHDMGLIGTLFCAIISGGSLVLIRPDDFIRKPFLWLKAMSDHKSTGTTAPNFAYGLIQKRVPKHKIEELDLSNLELCLCGAEMVYRETMEKFIKHLEPAKLSSKAILPVYGMAEATLAVSFTDPSKGMNFIKVKKNKLLEGKVVLDSMGEEICSVGKILQTFEIKICSESGSLKQDREVGRILLKGPSITKGYYRNREQTNRVFSDGWLDTGDEGFIIDGELFICGRIKDTMIIRGRNYYPTLIEEKLYDIQGLRKGRIIVTSLHNHKNDTEEVIVLAEVSSKNEIVENAKRIKDQIKLVILKESLPLFKIELYTPGVLLRTSSGKLKRHETLKFYQQMKLTNRQAKSFLRYSLQLLFLQSRLLKSKVSLRIRS